jgi:hypothetical protein
MAALMLQVLHVVHLRKGLSESAAAEPAKYFLSSMHKEDDTARRTRPINGSLRVSKPLYQKRFIAPL